MAWSLTIFAQDNLTKFNREKLINPWLNSINPSMLHNIKDSLLLNTNATFNYGKGDFTNYYTPNKYYKSSIKSESYYKISKTTTVYGFVNYNYNKGENTGHTSFLNPYKIPFNLTQTKKENKGNNRIEKYQLRAAISQYIFKNLSIGSKADYTACNFAKMKDMRNINQILDFKLNLGISYKFFKFNTIGFAYKYSRYIENLRIDKYGEQDKDYFALINRGAFMGIIEKYGSHGITDDRINKPWVDIADKFGLQYSFNNNIFNWYISACKESSKGHFGNENDNSIIYMKHNSDYYQIHSTISYKANNNTHILSATYNKKELTNYQNLYTEENTKSGLNLIKYYGKVELLDKINENIYLKYNLLWGNNFRNAPWNLAIEYKQKKIKKITSYFPDYRKQNISCQNANISISKFFNLNKKYITVKLLTGYTFGSGGEPIDGKYIQSSGSSTPPDYLNNLLYQEKEFLTASRINYSVSVRCAKPLKNNNELYILLYSNYTKPYNLKYLKGSFLNSIISLGLAF